MQKRRFVKESNQSLRIEDNLQLSEATKTITWQLMTTADVQLTDYGALLKQNNKRLKLEILSPETLSASVISLDPPPLKLDRRIEGLKRIEIRIPAYIFAKIDGNITVRLMAED